MRSVRRKSSISRSSLRRRREAGRKRARKGAKGKHGAVVRSRATTPARATGLGMGAAAKLKRRRPIPSPMPTRHVAPMRAAIVMPARSMPPSRHVRKVLGVPSNRPTLPALEFTEAGVLLAITYSIREGRRGEFFDLMRELKPLLHAIGGSDVMVYEDRSRPNYLMEVFRFKDEQEFTAFDDKFHKERKIAAVYALLDDIVEAEKSDFKIFERRL